MLEVSSYCCCYFESGAGYDFRLQVLRLGTQAHPNGSNELRQPRTIRLSDDSAGDIPSAEVQFTHNKSRFVVKIE